MTTNSDIQTLINEIIKFRDQRDWEQFHNIKDLSIGLNIESSELMELFLWKTDEEIEKKLQETEYKYKIEQELADNIIFCLLLAHKINADIPEIVLNKLKINQQKYPADKVKGKAKKYNEY